MEQDIAQQNLEAAHDWENRFHMAWPEIWAGASLFVNTTQKHAYSVCRAVDVERPFACVSCGKGLSYGEMLHTDAIKEKAALEALTCFRCRRRAETRTFLARFPAGGPTSAEQLALDEEHARLEEQLA